MASPRNETSGDLATSPSADRTVRRTIALPWRHPAFAALFAAMIWFGHLTTVPGGWISTVWPAAGVAVIWICTLGTTRRARIGIIATITIVAVPMCAAMGIAPELIGPYALGFGAQTLVADLILRRGGRDPLLFRESRDLYLLATAAIVASAVSATIRSAAFVAMGRTEAVELAWATWTLRDSLSILLLASAYMCLRASPLPRPNAGNVRRHLLLLPIIGLFGIVLFVTTERTLAAPLLAAAMCIWVAERFSTPVTAVINVLASSLVILASLGGEGLFGSFSIETSIIEAQALSMIFTVMTYVVALRRDDQDRLRRDLRHREAEFRAAFDSAPVGMASLAVTNGSAHIVRINEHLGSMTAGLPRDPTGAPLETIVVEDDRPALRHAIESILLLHREHSRCEVRLAGDDRRERWASISLAGLPTDGTEAPGGLAVVEDITARREQVQTLARQARFDPLTGLHNRRELLDRLGRVEKGTEPAAVFLLDLDGFKTINDRSGHEVGDQLLRTVSARLAATVRPTDLVVRLGGDEFVVVTSGRDAPFEVRTIAERLRSSICRPATLSGRTITMAVSIGATMARPGRAPEDVLRDADRAMYAAKRAGRSRIVVDWTAAGQEGAALDVGDIERALACDEFEMFGQPIIDLSTGRPAAIECLLRWRHPTRGLLGPGAFLELVESTPLVHDVGKRVIDRSLALAAHTIGDLDCAVHINVSGHLLETGDLARMVRSAAERHAVPLDRIVLELTESYAPMLELISLDDLEELRRDGVRIAIDDVGTGYSSLARITELSVDMLKIDGRFTAGIGSDSRCDAVIRAVISIGRALNLTVVGEGIETHRQHELLVASGCDQAQGYTYSRPLNAEALHECLHSDSRSAVG